MTNVQRLLTVWRQRGFSPVSLSPDLWLKADVGTLEERSSPTTPATVADDPVGTWQGHNANNAVAPADNARLFLEPNTVNFKPVLRPDGVNDRYTLTTPIVLDGAFRVDAIVRRTATNQKTVVAGSSGSALLAIYNDGKAYAVDDAGLFPNVAYTGTHTGPLHLRFSRPDAATPITVAGGGMAATALNGACGTITLEWLLARFTNSDFGQSDVLEIFVKKGSDCSANAADLDAYFAGRIGEVSAPVDLVFTQTGSQPTFPAGRLSTIGRLADIATATNTAGTRTLSATAPAAVFVNTAAAVTVNSGGSAYVGLSNAGGTIYVAAKYDLPNLKIALVAKNGGAEVELGSYTLGGALSAATVLEFTLCGRTAVAHAGGTFYLARLIDGTLEARDPAVLSTLRWGRWAAGASVTFGATTCGYFQGLGITDYHVVKDISGNTIIDGSGYITIVADTMPHGTGTSNDDVLTNWAGVHLSVWKINPVTADMVEIGKIFPEFPLGTYAGVAVPGGAGARPGLSDGCFRYDAGTGDYEFLVLNYLEAVITFRLFYGRASSLTGIQTPTITDLLPTGGGRYNAEFWRQDDGTYNVATSNHFQPPELWRGTSLATVAKTYTSTVSPAGWEGGTQVRIANKWFALYLDNLAFLHDGDSLTQVPFYTINNPPVNHDANAWPTVFEYPAGGVTTYYALIFDNNHYPQPEVTKDVSLGGGVYLMFVQAAVPIVFVADRTLPA